MAAENTTKKLRGKPFKPGQSGNPAGKPPGSLNKATRTAQTLLDGEVEGLPRKAIELALSGDMETAQRIVDQSRGRHRLFPCREFLKPNFGPALDATQRHVGFFCNDSLRLLGTGGIDSEELEGFVL